MWQERSRSSSTVQMHGLKRTKRYLRILKILTRFCGFETHSPTDREIIYIESRRLAILETRPSGNQRRAGGRDVQTSLFVRDSSPCPNLHPQNGLSSRSVRSELDRNSMPLQGEYSIVLRTWLINERGVVGHGEILFCLHPLG